MDRRHSTQTLTRRRRAPTDHAHGLLVEDGDTGGAPTSLVALALAAQDRCDTCVQRHAATAAQEGVSRREVLEALGTALLLSRDSAPTWATLADIALTAHRGAVS